MDTPTVISVSGSFLKFVGETLADVKRQDLAKLDVELLKLKRTILAERLDEFRANLDAAVKQEKARTEQDLISRGLANTTVRQSSLRALENDAAIQLQGAAREYNRAIEEIALMERRVVVQNRPPWWKNLLRWLRVIRS
jgi:hypothetical protein